MPYLLVRVESKTSTFSGTASFRAESKEVKPQKNRTMTINLNVRQHISVILWLEHLLEESITTWCLLPLKIGASLWNMILSLVT
jgi:hypothetical protein